MGAEALPRAPYRVLMTTDTVGGVWQYALELCRQLCAGGHEVVLAASGADPSPDQAAEALAIEGLELHAMPYRLEWMSRPWDDIARAGDWLLDLAGRVRPDIIHLNDYSQGGLPWPAPVLMVGHSCVCSWWQAVRGAPAPEEWAQYRARVSAGLRAADLVVAPTAAMLDSLEAHYGPLPATRVIANGRTPLARPRTGAPREPLILAAGRLWDAGKNIQALTAVAGGLSWPVCVAGEARHPDGGDESLHPGVRLLGQLPRDALAGWMARAGIYALPARYEPFGLSALEAATAGCALVLGDIPSLREVWGEAALYVPPDDHDALAATLQRLIDDPELRERQATRAAARAARYTPEAMARGYLAAYAGLAAGAAELQPGVPATAPVSAAVAGAGP
ncbi:glycosyltransferase family 4 protein [Lysobacter sp. GX 14042]|uniref:glycosyltransferase family 4 protein n=1 Tax=Lysobacter sp. GX 14042 TaxID=2907155 RepID=UPI001F3A5B64|nr:glycosyltransferase family 4 protein [Lysobacter sp. GX 14042]MCE7031717.1 glycosyltransferase family 4 protein [Lysobacter sp. GX 14042]